jgi:aminopeptidase N
MKCITMGNQLLRPCQHLLAHYWYPCKDGPEDKVDSVYLDITVPDTIINGNNVIAVSNGLLENISVANNKVTYSWRHRYPIVSYYVMMAISNYSHFQQSFTCQDGEAFPIDYYVFKEHDSTSQIGVTEMPEVMQFYSDIFGKYPFCKEKYAMSELGYYGAIENQTNTIINSMDLSWFSTSIHELAHMWFGDMITCADWHHAWMNEGFATYSEALWEEHKNGITAYHNYFNSSMPLYGGTLYLQNDLDTFNIFQGIVYTKGAWVLHMLRGVLGDSIFFNCLKTYASSPGYMYKNASTEDFRNLCENISWKNLTTFFDQWIYDEYYPKYFYNFFQDSTSKILTLHIYQAQDSLNGWHDVFEMPLQIKIIDVNGNDTIITVLNNQKNQEYTFQLNENVSHYATSVIIDPDRWVIHLSYFKPLLPVEINEITDKTLEFELYPNPSSSIITFTIPEKSTIEILNIEGQIIRSINSAESHTSIDIADIAKGLYFVKVSSEKGIAVKKFIKE